MYNKAFKLTVIILAILPGAFVFADDFKVTGKMPESTLVFGAGSDHVIGHDDGQIDKLATSRDMYQCYREPVVVRTNSGRLVTMCHAGNRHAWPERSGQDLAVTYSDDGGKTWARPRVAGEHGNYSMQSHGLVYDAIKDRLICLYTVYRWDYSLIKKGRGAEASAPAIKIQLDAGEDLQRQYMITSDDGGESWSKPKDISSMMSIMGGNGHFGSSEGRQITTGKFKGRLLLPGGIRCEDNKGQVTEKTLHVWISDDHGKTWKPSKPIIKTNDTRQYSCEARVTELADGRLLYNVRTRYMGRQISTSSDGGKTWSKLRGAQDLKTTQCNGSMMTVQNANGKLTNTLLCSLPFPGGRNEGVVYVSSDGGMTWPKRNDIIPGFFGYSALVQIDNKTVGLFYEDNHYRDIRLIRLPIKSLR